MPKSTVKDSPDLPRTIATVGDLRKLIDQLPDDMAVEVYDGSDYVCKNPSYWISDEYDDWGMPSNTTGQYLPVDQHRLTISIG